MEEEEEEEEEFRRRKRLQHSDFSHPQDAMVRKWDEHAGGGRGSFNS